MEAHADRLRSVGERWEEAERRLKRLEFIDGDLNLPVVNELRYAGFHIVQALRYQAEGRTDLIDEQLRKAYGHCDRGLYDATEAEVLHYLTKIKQFKADYSTVPIDCFDWVGTLGLAQQAESALVRDTAKRAERGQHYVVLDGHCGGMRTAVEQMDLARGEMNKKLAEHEAKERQLEEERRLREEQREEQRREREELQREREEQRKEREAARRATRLNLAIGALALVVGAISAGAAVAALRPATAEHTQVVAPLSVSPVAPASAASPTIPVTPVPASIPPGAPARSPRRLTAK